MQKGGALPPLNEALSVRMRRWHACMSAWDALSHM